MSKECLQLSLSRGTPCFETDVGRTACSLAYCPTASYLTVNPGKKLWDVLHTHCVMSYEYGRQTFCEGGKGEFIATIALRKKYT